MCHVNGCWFMLLFAVAVELSLSLSLSTANIFSCSAALSLSLSHGARTVASLLSWRCSGEQQQKRLRMCNSRKDAVATNPRRTSSAPRRTASASARTATSTSSAALSTHTGSSSSTKPSAASTSSTAPSLASLRELLPESPTLYPFSEICSATNNFLAKRLSSSSNSWRCSLRGKDAVVFQRRFLGDPASLRRRLASTSKIHHTSIVRLLGASLGGDHLFLVYEYVHGASLADCLRNPNNPGFTPLSTWVDRMQVAADVAQGLEYIHHYADIGTATPGGARRRGPVHNRLTSSGVMLTDPQLRAKICHFGAAELSGEVPAASDDDEADRASPKLQRRRTASREVRFEGTRGYIAPEVLQGGAVSQKSDVFGFGVLLLELISGEEPVKHRYNRETGEYESVSLVATAREVMGGGSAGQEAAEGAAAAAERHRKLRRWVDRRLKDSYPVEVAERAVRVALGCVDGEAGRRPDMVRVAGKLSRLLVESRAWAEKVRVPTEFSVSMAPR